MTVDRDRTNARTKQSHTLQRKFFLFLPLLLALELSGCGYNTMVSLKEQVQSAWAQVENQLQRRNDLIPNLVEVTKGYAAHEKGVFDNVANARAKLIGAGTRGDQIAAANEVSSALSRLLALSESYPNLKADQQFARLSDELAAPRTASLPNGVATTKPYKPTTPISRASRR